MTKAFAKIWLCAFLAMAVVSDTVGAQSLDPFRELARRITSRLGPSPGRVAFLGIADRSGAVSGLERYLSDKLAAALTATGQVTLTDEAARRLVLAEIHQNLTDVFDRDMAQSAGRLTGAAWILKGAAYVFETDRRAELALHLIRVETGEYRVEQSDIPVSPATLALRRQEMTKATVLAKRPPLELKMAVVASRPIGNGQARFLGAVRDGDRLRSNDDVKIHFQTNVDAYVYVVWVDPQGKTTLQFPSRDAGADNRVQGGRVHSAPQNEQEWYYLDETTGAETLYLVASYEPLKDLSALLRQAEAGGLGDSSDARNELDRLFGDLRERGVAGVRPGETQAVAAKGSATSASAQFSVVRGYAEAVRRLTFRHDP